MIKHKKEEKILKFIEAVDWLFDVNNYTKELCYEKEDKDKHWEDCIMAEITTDHTYRKICITFYPIFFTKDKEEQCQCIIHELTHTITEDMFDCYQNMLKWSFVTEGSKTRQRTYNGTCGLFTLYLGQGKKEYFQKSYWRVFEIGIIRLSHELACGILLRYQLLLE